MLRRVSLVSSVLVAMSSLACGSKPPPPPRPIVPVPVATVPPPPPLAPARWVKSIDGTQIGLDTREGTIVFVGGRRALVAADGTTREETEPAPEPIDEMIEVPTREGSVLIGRSARAIYRFESAVGKATPIARLTEGIESIGSGPGMVVVWARTSAMPIFLDVTGAQRTLSGLPSLPIKSMAFVSATDGAAVLDPVGLVVTSDGGATWRVVSDARSDALKMTRVVRRGANLRAFMSSGGPESLLDPANAKMNAATPAPKPGEAPLLKWISRTSRDPLEAAVSAGTPGASGEAITASHGLLARVNTKTGALIELLDFSDTDGSSTCRVGKSGGATLMACNANDEEGGDHYRPFGVFNVELSGGALPKALGKPVVLRDGEAELRFGAAGGVLFAGACEEDDNNKACIRSPNGRWTTLDAGVSLSDHGASALSDGRVAFVRGIDGDDPVDPPADPNAEEKDDERKIRISLMTAEGTEQTLPTITLSPIEGTVRIDSVIDEGSDKKLHLVMRDDKGPMVISQGLGGEAATITRVAGAQSARVRGRFGFAVGEHAVFASTDSGATWGELKISEAFANALSSLSLDSPQEFAISEVGARVGEYLRIGWGATEPMPEHETPTGGATVQVPKSPPTTVRDTLLTCTTDGPNTGTAPMSFMSQANQILATKTPAAKGQKRIVATSSVGRAGMLSPVGVLEEQGPDTAPSPQTWSLRWLDSSEFGARPRTWTGTPPKGIPWNTRISTVSASGDRALFFLRNGSRAMVARVKPGSMELVDVTSDLQPSGEAVFGSERGEPIAWLSDTAVVAWTAGDPVRKVGLLTSRNERMLGIPTKDGVPVLVTARDWTYVRTFAIPAFDKKAPVVPPTSFLEGWNKVANVRTLLAGLTPCGPKAPAGSRFFVTRSSISAKVDGTNHLGSNVLYDVRVSPTEACVLGVNAILSATGTKATLTPAEVAKKAGPAEWVRADFTNKRSEGGTRGVAPTPMRRLTCALAPK